jgi:hypothetical protein
VGNCLIFNIIPYIQAFINKAKGDEVFIKDAETDAGYGDGIGRGYDFVDGEFFFGDDVNRHGRSEREYIIGGADDIFIPVLCA